jgi:hypothetical protein
MWLVALAVLAVSPIQDAGTKAPPPGFVALFNGKDLMGWKADEKEASTHWTARNGVLHYDGKGDNLRTAKDYGDFELYVDWRIQKDGDSGIYLRGKPQVQIWDPALPVAKGYGSGGLYNNKVGRSAPLTNSDKPIGEWNTFHIIMTGDKVTVFLNGEKVVDDVALENYPTYTGELPAKGTIELQHHGNPLEFRNIFIKEL